MSEGLILRQTRLAEIRRVVHQLPDVIEAKGQMLRLLEGDPNDESVLKALHLASLGFFSTISALFKQVAKSAESEKLVQQMASFKMPEQ